QGAAQLAKEVLTNALTIVRASGNRANEAQALYALARAERALGNLTQAHTHSQSALSKAEAVRSEVWSQQLRASYRASVQQFYELHLELLMQLHEAHPTAGYAALAVQASEQARARSLLELLTEARTDLRNGADPALLARADTLSQQLNAKAQRQLQLTMQRGNEAQLSELQQEISALEDESNQLEAQLRQSNPRYAALTHPQPLSLAQMQQQLEPNSLLLEYALGEERSWLWAVTKTSLTSFALPKRAEIELAVRQLRELLLARSQRVRDETQRQRAARIAQTDLQAAAAAATLSQMLLQPVAPLLENRQLIIVADGALQAVPFAALSVVSNQMPVASSLPNRQPTSHIRQPLIVNH
ncbi:MAG TPA: hypothetical protein VFZ34_04715, partial [Blastocatellia bacterium]|nr:hypothetical protein [Blastocatellia bacterium]